MTTIAANRKCMAADRKVTDDNGRRTAKKIVRIGDAIVGCAGSSGACNKFIRYLEVKATCADDEEADLPDFEKDDELSALILTPEGLFTVATKDCELEEVLDPFYAIGSGGMAALAAMHLGLEPPEAVEIACKVDAASDGPIDVIGFSS